MYYVAQHANRPDGIYLITTVDEDSEIYCTKCN